MSSYPARSSITIATALRERCTVWQLWTLGRRGPNRPRAGSCAGGAHAADGRAILPHARQCACIAGHCKALALNAGDLNKPELGLAPEVYARLAAEVDTIVHNGALVNHAFAYRELFEPNVLGTVEVMKLAVATRVKAVAFLSSVSVAHGLDHPQPVTEEEVGTRLCTECPGDGSYALGCVRCLVSVCAHCSKTSDGPACKSAAPADHRLSQLS